MMHWVHLPYLNPDAQEQEELNDLANLALARTHYELKEFTEAIGYYQNVGAESEYFVDRLYEMAWTFIGMERWDDAVGVIEVFLVAYPEDEHAIRFQNTLGDLYMKLQEYEKALMTYEEVSDQLCRTATFRRNLKTRRYRQRALRCSYQ